MDRNGRDYWNEMNAEQRARFIRDMPLAEDEEPQIRSSLFWWPLTMLLGIGMWVIIGKLVIDGVTQ